MYTIELTAMFYNALQNISLFPLPWLYFALITHMANASFILLAPIANSV